MLAGEFVASESYYSEREISCIQMGTRARHAVSLRINM